MSAPLEVIAAHMPYDWCGGMWDCTAPNCDVDTSESENPDQDFAAHVLDALRASGFAVVELPEPTDTYSHLTEMSMLGWEVGYGPVFVEALPGNPPTVRVEVDGENVIEVSPSYAAQFAAALLAAADAADRAGDDGEGQR